MYNFDQIISDIKTYPAFLGDLKKDEPLGPKSTFKIGGKAKLYIAPQNYISFLIAFKVILPSKIPFFVIGGASNLVFPDNDFEGIILSTTNFNDVEIFPVSDCPEDFGVVKLSKTEILVTAFAGTPMASIVNFCIKNNISGMEEFAGLPGTIGGAVFMNARCFNKSISDVLFSTTWMDYSCGEVKLHHQLYNSSEWDYKKSPFQDSKKFITTVTLLLKNNAGHSPDTIEANSKKYIAERVNKGHFKYPSAGSVFKNNHAFGKPSGQLIDEAGLKGYQVGGAQIAPFHGNFIININHATAEDVKSIVEHVKQEIKNKNGFDIETEIIFV